MAKVFVSVMHHRYYLHPEESQWEYEIDAAPEVLTVIDRLFEQKETFESKAFWRAHVPYVPYHLDPENDGVDLQLKKLYAVIHEYGNDEAKQHIETLPFYR
ncbi:transposase [Paenisporosarcina indica]|uniref:transposase n=1 Tax=Paenisporosarcina indica TaxID=650093 RepID=UPI0009500D07|nr:transposase [Paenisporosarcina indica]